MELQESPEKAFVDKLRKPQVEDWLRQADRLIRAGRYLAADELLQKVRHVHPHNEIAATYQDRIHFLIKQLSQRVGLDSATQVEVRRFIDVLATRKTNLINSHLLSAKKLMEEGHLQKAQEFITKALAIDSANTYGRALQQRLEELKIHYAAAAEDEDETQFRSFLMELWRRGKPGSEHDGLVASTQAALHITHAQRVEILRSVRNELYMEALREIWNTGGLSAFEMEIVEALRTRYEVSWLDHSLIETTLLREVRKNRIRANILIVDGDDANLLSVSQILRSHSYAVVAAASVAEALEAIKTVTPDVILSELTFPDGSLGFDLFGFARETKRTQPAPFLFMTSTLDRTTQIIGKKVGVDDFLPKPIDGELLIATITGLLLKKSPQPTSTVHRNGLGHFFKK